MGNLDVMDELEPIHLLLEHQMILFILIAMLLVGSSLVVAVFVNELLSGGKKSLSRNDKTSSGTGLGRLERDRYLVRPNDISRP